MRKLLIAVVVAVLPLSVQAQRRDTALATETIPSEIRREVESRWNADAELRSSSNTSIATSREVRGNVAVQNGPLTIRGHVTGNVIAVNCDVTLRPGSRIDGDLWVVGGRLDGRDSASIGGEIRVYRSRVGAVREGNRLILDDGDLPPARRAPQWDERTRSDPLYVATAGAYNRVEGLPIKIGPSIDHRDATGSIRVDAFAIVRTGSTFEADHGDVGHDIKAEFRLGRRTGPSVGGRLFNLNDPVEAWQLSDNETSLAAFLFRRDYRDYYARHGASAFARMYGGRHASLTASLSNESWDSRDRLNPFTVFRGEAAWRPNPAMDVGRMHLANLTLRYDSRTDPDEPRSGIFAVIDAERGTGRLTTIAPASSVRPYVAGDAISYDRAFVDLRSYNRLSPSGQLSFRVVGAGWLRGDALPLERRLSVEGPSALPGFDFRDVNGTNDKGSCSIGAPVGRPAECDRIALVQVEYRGNLRWDVDDWREDAGRYVGAHSDASWVMFADAGRGWLVGPPSGDMTYPQSELPPTSTFRTDIGVGFDFGGIGVYAAKALSSPSEPVNFFLRLQRRF